MFNHYFVRNAVKRISENGNDVDHPLHLAADDSWVNKFERSELKMKRQELFINIHIPKEILG